MYVHSRSSVELIGACGLDVTVVNAARISLGKFVTQLSERDRRLIRYLANNGHWTPFGHCSATLYIRTPIFVARQLMRSNVGIVYNEISRRYVSSPPSFWHPETWRSKPLPGMNKQGSGPDELSPEASEAANRAASGAINACEAAYQELLKLGVAPEQARAFLPLGTYTELYMTATLAAFARVVRLRIDPHAQHEIRQLASRISDICATLWPVSWEALMSAPAPATPSDSPSDTPTDAPPDSPSDSPSDTHPNSLSDSPSDTRSNTPSDAATR